MCRASDVAFLMPAYQNIVFVQSEKKKTEYTLI